MSRLVRVLGAPLARGSDEPTAEPFDAIIILGAPLARDGSLTPVVDERVRAGVALWRSAAAPLIAVCGGLGMWSATWVEADGMAHAIRALGVPADRLVIERTSRSTAENASKLAGLLLPRGLRRVLLVTQPFHLRRAVLWFRRSGFEATGWLVRDSLQFASSWRGLRWIAKEYLAFARDWLRMRVRIER